MSPDEQPNVPKAPPDGSHSASGGVWVAPTVDDLQAKLPQYEVLEILGRGGMGAVYKARQKSLKRLVAIKILPLGMVDDEFKFVERFENEAQTMAQMNHPAIVAVHDFGETIDGLLYFVMEFVDGTDVHKMIQASGRLSSEHALAITAHVCDALAYAHKRGVIHRDIKPANILIDSEGHIKVADFGLAKMNDPVQTSGLTKTHMAMGTPDYVAPEVLVTGMLVDHRADIYAVGVTLYQMLTGEVPRGLFKLPSQKNIGIDPRFDEIICRTMEQDLEERYQSATDVRHALDVILTTPQPMDNGSGVVAAKDVPRRPVARAPRAPGEMSAPAQQTVPGKAKAPPKKQSAASIWLSIGGIVAVLGAAGFFVVGNRHHPTPAVVSVDSAFLAEVAAAPPERQVELVVEKIQTLNGGKVTFTTTIKQGKLTGLSLVRSDGGSEQIHDLSPIAALRNLDDLTVRGCSPLDLSFLRGLKLEQLSIHGGTFALDVLRDLPLVQLDFNAVAADFSALKGTRLTRLQLTGCRVSDLAFVEGMPLRSLCIDRTLVTDLSPLRGLPLTEIKGDFILERDMEILRSIPTLQSINERPAAEFFATAATAPLGKTIDLLALVDVKRDSVAGEWSRHGGNLIVKAAKPGLNGTPRLQLPYQPPEEYDFEIEFTPESGTNASYQILSARQHSFAWVMDANLKTGMKAGFDRIDGQLISGRTSGTTMKPKFLTNGQRHRSTVEVRKTGVRALLDGEVLVSYKKDGDTYKSLDSSPNEAMRDTLHLGLAAYDRAVSYHKIIVREISGTGTVDATASGVVAPTLEPPIDWLKSPWEAPWSLENGRLKSSKQDANRFLGGWRDGALRVRFRSDTTGAAGTAPPLQFTFRFGRNGAEQGQLSSYQLQIYPARRATSLLFIQRDAKTSGQAPAAVWKDRSFPPPAAGSDEVELELRAFGPAISLWAGATEVASAHDERAQNGGWLIIASPDVEVTALETRVAGPADAAKLPNIRDWQDITTAIREKARGMPGVKIDADAVRLAEGAAAQRIYVTQPGTRDFTVRVRYTGGVQIDRVNEQGAFDFILCQRKPPRVAFKRYSPGTGVTEDIAQSVPFAASYDETKLHDLVAIIEGPRMRVWVDDRFIAEANDEAITSGAGGIALKGYTPIYKVEVANLSADKAVR